MKALIKLLGFLKDYKKMILFSIIILIIAVSANLSTPILTQISIDCGIKINTENISEKEIEKREATCSFVERLTNTQSNEKGNLTIIILGGVGILLAALVSGGLIFISGFFIIRAAQGMGYKLRNALYKKIMSFSFSNLDNWRTGELMIRLNSDVNNLRMFIRMGLFIIVQSLFMIIGGLIGMFTISRTLATIMAIIMPVILLLLLIFAALIRPLFMKVRKKLDKLNNAIQENLAGAKVVRAFSRQAYEVRTFKKKNEEFLKLYMKAGYTISVLFPFLFFVAGITLLISIWVGGNLVVNTDFTIGKLVSFSQYAMMSTFPILMLGMVLSGISMASASAERIYMIFKEETKINEKEKPIVKDKLNGEIEFKNVSFHYGDGEKALDSINLMIKPGEKVGILGTTGSGKSSIANLIPRLYDAQEGQILIDGINIKDLSLNSLRSRIGIVMQDPILFSGTIKDNLIFGNDSATQEEIEEAVEISDAKNFISEKENKYDESVGERGSGLSGGQKQRVAIARAIISNPDILIFDDATSSVDLYTETKIYRNIYNKLKNVTTIIISQKVNSIKNIEKIVVMDKGKIIGIGNHNKLMKENEIYREIYETQNADV